MAEPFIFIGTHTVKEGKLDEYKESVKELVEIVEANEPRLIAFNAYLDEQSREGAMVQVHPDAASMEFHMQIVGQHISRSSEFLDTTSIQIYGTPNESTLEMIEQLSQAGLPITVKPHGVAGFTRSAAEPAGIPQ